MTFQDAIISVINDFGKDILSNASLQNFLNDYNAFDESKAFRVILKNLISEGYLDQMLLIKNWDSSSSQLCARFVDNTGFQIEKAEYVLNSIREFGIRKVKKKLVISPVFCIFIVGNQNITKRTSDDYQGQSYRNFLYY